MVFVSLEKTVKTMIFKPVIFLPMIVVALVVYLLSNLTTWVLERPITDFVLYSEAFAGTDILSVFLTNYPLETIAMLLCGIFVLLLSIIALLSMARVANGKKFVQAINESVLEWKKSLGLTIFVLVVSFLLFILWYVVATIFGIVSDFVAVVAVTDFLLLILLPIIIFVVGLILLVRLAFVLPAFVDNNVKKAFQKSWDFSQKKFISNLVLIIVVLIITYILWNWISYIGVLVDIEIIFDLLGDVIATTFFGLAVSYYYFK